MKKKTEDDMKICTDKKKLRKAIKEEVKNMKKLYREINDVDGYILSASKDRILLACALKNSIVCGTVKVLRDFKICKRKNREIK